MVQTTGKKRKLSSVQKNTIQQTKLKKRKLEKKRERIQTNSLQNNNNVQEDDETQDQPITEEDYDFFKSKLNKLGFLVEMNPEELNHSHSFDSKGKKNASNNNNNKQKSQEEAEQEYEKKTRTTESWDKNKVLSKLPTFDQSSGKILNSAPTPSSQLSQVREKILQKNKSKEQNDEVNYTKLNKKTKKEKKAKTPLLEDIELETVGQLPNFLYQTMKNKDITAAELVLYTKKQKEYIANIASTIMEDPESNYKKLHDLHVLCEFNPATYKLKNKKKLSYRKGSGNNKQNEDEEEEESEANKVLPAFVKTHTKVRQLAILSMAALFSDILPGYRVKEDASDMSNKHQQLKKEVLKVRQFETSLVSAYQRYLVLLERFIKENTPSLYTSSLKAYCQVLVSKPHFNFRSSILQVIVSVLGSGDSKASQLVKENLETLFENDDSGEVSLDAVRLFSQYLKKKKYHVKNTNFLECFLKLKFTEDLSKFMDGGLTRQHISKKEKKKMPTSQLKATKEKLELEREMRETEAQESRATIRRNQTELLKAIFMIYFRIIKEVQNSPLIPSVLAGLAQFSHLINLDFQTDLITSIKNLMKDQNTSLDIVARCTETVFTNIKLHGGATIDIDLKDFYELLYQKLFELPLQPDAILHVLNCIKLMVTENKEVLLPRAGAFIKRLATVALHLPPYAIIAVLTCLQRVLHFHPQLNRMIEADDRPGSTDAYSHFALNPDTSNALSSTLWELNLLEQHYHATVSERAVAVAESKATRLQPDEMFNQFDSRKGGFNPPIPKPAIHAYHRQLEKHPNHKIYLKTPEPSLIFQETISALQSL